ncbi:MAG: hypothetical protein ACOX57_11800 [Limnochordia bacterium]|jgi:hypothetical protein|nr:hypothetical protein [Bacillota bacterium]
MGWNGWPFERVVILFTLPVFLLIWVQVTLLHYRQNFRHWSQWVPVLALPTIALNALLFSLWNLSWLRTLFIILCLGDILGGLTGFYFHLQGVGKRVDGYRLQNFLVGPPVVLPLMITATSVLGLLATYWS